MQGKLDFVLLHVRDMAAERDFYAETFDLQLEGQSPDFVQFLPQGGGAIFALSREGQPTPTATIELWWEVADVDAMHVALVKRGVEIVSAPKDEPFGRALLVKDPEGNLVSMFRPRQG
jgi:predicted enzyme related to lactoylglutathione lyase